MTRKSKKRVKTPAEKLFKDYYRPMLNDQTVKKVRAYKVKDIAFMLGNLAVAGPGPVRGKCHIVDAKGLYDTPEEAAKALRLKPCWYVDYDDRLHKGFVAQRGDGVRLIRDERGEHPGSVFVEDTTKRGILVKLQRRHRMRLRELDLQKSGTIREFNKLMRKLSK